MKKIVKISFLSVVIIAALACLFSISVEAKKQSVSEISKKISTISDEKYIKMIAFKPNSDIHLSKTNSPKIDIIEYGSFTCHHCSSFFKENYSKIISKYGNKIRFIHRSIISDKLSLNATKTIKCLPHDEKILDYINLIYQTQQSWIINSEEKSQEKLIEILKNSGAKTDGIEKCINDKKLEQALMAEREEIMTKLQITSTPLIIVGKSTLKGYVSFQELSMVIDMELAK